MYKQCAVDDCDEPVQARGWCWKHYRRWLRHGDTQTVKPHSVWGERNGFWKGDQVDGQAIHTRLKRARGNASEHPCWQCGMSAVDWAYDHTDPNELIDRQGNPYSLNMHEYYVPLCRRCHVRFDHGLPPA